MRIVVGERRFDVDLYRDDAGNFVADAIAARSRARGAGRPVPAARAIADSAEGATESLITTLERMYSSGRGPGDAPAAGSRDEGTGAVHAS
jgi:hypothetical protein